MFSGIVQEIGTVKNINSSSGILNIEISCSELIKDLKEGDSVSVDGCCETIVKTTSSSFIVQATGETLNKTNFKSLKKDSKINLEAALKIGDKINGHLVTGHIDTTGEVSDVLSSYDNKIVKIVFPLEFKNYIAAKGSITVNGVSLTVIDVKNNEFSFTLIPYTRDNTNLGLIKEGDLVNLEVDLISRYLVNYMENTKTLVLK